VSSARYGYQKQLKSGFFDKEDLLVDSLAKARFRLHLFSHDLGWAFLCFNCVNEMKTDGGLVHNGAQSLHEN
jgi:hypothetical protein